MNADKRRQEMDVFYRRISAYICGFRFSGVGRYLNTKAAEKIKQRKEPPMNADKRRQEMDVFYRRISAFVCGVSDFLVLEDFEHEGS